MSSTPEKPAAVTPKSGELEDTALSSLTAEDRDRLAMDAWEPTLLRKLLEAQDKLPRKPKRSGSESN